MINDNGWSEYEKLVMYRLDELAEITTKLREDVMQLKIRSSLWGAAAGAITGLMAYLGGHFTKH